MVSGNSISEGSQQESVWKIKWFDLLIIVLPEVNECSLHAIVGAHWSGTNVRNYDYVQLCAIMNNHPRDTAGLVQHNTKQPLIEALLLPLI